MYLHFNKKSSLAAGFLLFSTLVFAYPAGKDKKLFTPVTDYENKAYSKQKTEIINTKNGPVRGLVSSDSAVELFAGIPYAKAPVGDLRWREPQNPENWTEVLEADSFGPLAMQPTGSPIYNALFNFYINTKKPRSQNAPMSEDCLYLNIWRPKNIPETEKLPVLVYIHGGSLMTGSSWSNNWDGKNMAERGLVFVTIAYRLGVFGYYAHDELEAESPVNTTGDYGLLDQVKALEWIHNNIEAFGGDSSNVTIAGESAGSTSVNALCATPLSKGYFDKAIAESSSIALKNPPHTYRTMENAKKMGLNIMKEFRVSSIKEMRNIPAQKLIKTKYQNSGVTVDGYALPESPYEIYKKGMNHEKALLHGFNDQEAYSFIYFATINEFNYEERLNFYFGQKGTDLSQAFPCDIYTPGKEPKVLMNRLLGAGYFAYPHYNWSKLLTEQNVPVYEYYFNKTNPCVSTYHSGEIVYAYDNLPKSELYYKTPDRELSEVMASYWYNFAKTGNPNGENLPEWKSYSESNGLVMELNSNCAMVEDPFIDIYNVLDKE